ncbi:hypothetical protein HPB49_012677 [Dermacentor silvarum]|uniref:Uncharacterized protein n=1 Tax=Dermacentor silvarum TaxID=543639 RepID=A0ACB8CXF8_DERSI|nr:hypothetical protein HPB49_012677 [Dermacentor silvarum]
MEDIFHWCREGNAFQVRVWLDDTEHDMNQGDDHGFSPLHWAAKEGHANIVDMLIVRGSRVNATNMGDDTALHLAAAHGHRDIVHMDLIASGALVSIANKYGETPLDKCKGHMGIRLREVAEQAGQDLKKVYYKDQNWLGTKTRTRDATLSRHSGINMDELKFFQQIASTTSGETWKGSWQGNDIIAKILKVGEVTPRISRDFNDQYPRLRIFSHPNVLPVIGCVNRPPHLIVVQQYLPHGMVVDQAQALKFAIDVARGMAFLHTLEPMIPNYQLSSKHVMVDEEMTAYVNMADTKFSFQERGKMYHPAWYSPEALQKKQDEMNWKAADMWSFAILLWELATRQVPFADLSPMEIGMKVALEELRVTIPPGISPHMSRLIRICMNEDPGKRPTFEMILPILEKMKH